MAPRKLEVTGSEADPRGEDPGADRARADQRNQAGDRRSGKQRTMGWGRGCRVGCRDGSTSPKFSRDADKSSKLLNDVICTWQTPKLFQMLFRSKRTNAHTCSYMLINTNACKHTYMFTHTHTLMHTYKRTHTLTHTYKRTHTLMHTFASQVHSGPRHSESVHRVSTWSDRTQNHVCRFKGPLSAYRERITLFPNWIFLLSHTIIKNGFFDKKILTHFFQCINYAF